MTEIHGIARLKIHAGKLDEFKRLQAKCLEIVRAPRIPSAIADARYQPFGSARYQHQPCCRVATALGRYSGSGKLHPL